MGILFRTGRSRGAELFRRALKSCPYLRKNGKWIYKAGAPILDDMKKQILTDIKLSPAQSERELLRIAEKKLRAKPAYFKILKKSLDARDKGNIRYI